MARRRNHPFGARQGTGLLRVAARVVGARRPADDVQHAVAGAAEGTDGRAVGTVVGQAGRHAAPAARDDRSGVAAFRREVRVTGAVQEAEQERGLGPRRVALELVERVLVAQDGVAGDHRALLHHVVDALDHAVGRHLTFAQPVQGLDLPRHALALWQARALTCQERRLPAQHVTEQGGGLVVEVVSGGHDLVAVLQRHAVEHVALAQPAHTARRPPAQPGRGGDVIAVLLGEVDGVRLLSTEQVKRATTQQTKGPNKVLMDMDIQFGLGFMRLAMKMKTPIVPFAFLGGGGSLAGVDFRFLSNVPEPASALLLLVAGGMLMVGRRRN